MFKSSTIILLAIAASVVSTAADARPRPERQQAIITCNDRGCSDSMSARQATQVSDAREWTFATGESRPSAKPRRSAPAARRAARIEMPAPGAAFAEPETPHTVRTRATYSDTGVIGGRPAGCPHQFCGCEASLHVFGRIRPELNLASNWIRYFPRTQAAPGMAAARSGHVMVLISHVGGNDWLVHDGNSGGGRTREHVRSVSGYVIVDPHGSTSASLSAPRRSHRYDDAVAVNAFASDEQPPTTW